jgi:D-3-phosphoglycerate dehydrogenase / 2-oxoglutarate reductase
VGVPVRGVGTMRVLVTDPIAEDGLTELRRFAEVDVKLGLSGPDLLRAVAEYEALVVRSETRVTAEVIHAGSRLQVIGRAGVGVDNIDMDAATQHGVLVVNSPTGNTIAATEHTLAMLLALARNIPQAYGSLKAGEWQRSRFVGSEVRGRTLGILGLGKIGFEVAKRARGFEMELIGYDPYISAEQARAAGIELLSVPEIMRRADFITVHTPLTPATTNLVGEKELALAKPSLRIINCARGGIINEEALAKAVEEGRIAGAAIDVFTREPATDNVLVKSDGKIIVTPHLGASTEEAQIAVAVDVARQIEEVAQGKQPRFAVNAPGVLPEELEFLRPFMLLAEKLGRLYTQLTEGQIGPIELTVGGDAAAHETAPITTAVLKGILEATSDQKVNGVNAGVLAKARGLSVTEKRVYDIPTYESLVTLQVADTLVAGTVEYGEPRIVQMNRYRVDLPASGIWLLARHRDQPGMIGKVGSLLGDSDVNISGMQVGRLTARGDDSMMILIVDDPVSDDVLARVRAIPGVGETRLVSL